MSQLTQNFRQIRDNEFKLIVLRNICFLLNPIFEDTVVCFESIFTNMRHVLDQSRMHFEKMVEREREFCQKQIPDAKHHE